MRIVGGKHRGRRLTTPADRDVRPTTDRTREALFNILDHAGLGPEDGGAVDGARVLDAFCGTGALGLEALSRGAASAVFMDIDRRSLDLTLRNIGDLGEGGRATVLRADATRPPPAAQPCDLLFADPPYGRGMAVTALTALAARGWLAPRSLAVVEIGASEVFAVPEGFEEVDRRRYGDTAVLFLRFG